MPQTVRRSDFAGAECDGDDLRAGRAGAAGRGYGRVRLSGRSEVKLPKVGGPFTPNLEIIVAMKPDLVVVAANLGTGRKRLTRWNCCMCLRMR